MRLDLPVPSSPQTQMRTRLCYVNLISINKNNQGLVEPVAIGTGYVLLSQTIVGMFHQSTKMVAGTLAQVQQTRNHGWNLKSLLQNYC